MLQASSSLRGRKRFFDQDIAKKTSDLGYYELKKSACINICYDLVTSSTLMKCRYDLVTSYKPGTNSMSIPHVQ